MHRRGVAAVEEATVPAANGCHSNYVTSGSRHGDVTQDPRGGDGHRCPGRGRLLCWGWCGRTCV